ATIWFFNRLLHPGPLLLLLGGGLLGAVVYFGTALLLGVKEIRTLPLALLQFLRHVEDTPAA
ncbi:MAG: hypothetical protein KAR65_05285, partial [Anaerolineales bacterium]|nr:hypothetical protein [Anaerolineales bacterium]